MASNENGIPHTFGWKSLTHLVIFLIDFSKEQFETKLLMSFEQLENPKSYI